MKIIGVMKTPTVDQTPAVIEFFDEEHQSVGKILVKGGKLMFEGHADKAAWTFLDELSGFFDGLVEKAVKERGE